MNRLPILHPGRREPFPPVDRALAEPNGLLAAGGDLSCERLLDAYSQGIFPWFSQDQSILWWSPEPRTVFDTDGVHVAARLARWLRQCRWRLSADTAFREVMIACAAPRADQGGTWIGEDMLAAYCDLHQRGFAHSVEIRDGESLVGGIYGVAVGRMFFGESMFSRATNASKLALLALCRALHGWDVPLLDAQMPTSHLSSLGAYEMPRAMFCERVAQQVALPAIDDDWNARIGSIAITDLARMRA
ncbi:MAG: leucyl/phenylalanyl-tRNA--protein transferase [Rhodanobacteraceae bacterium]